MDFFVSGLVVDGQTLSLHSSVLAMEPDSSSGARESLDDKKRFKMEIKREKNRESSARSRQRKKDEDERNMKEIEQLEAANERLREVIEEILSEGRALREKVDPYFLTQPVCPGCAPQKDIGEIEGTPSVPQDLASDDLLNLLHANALMEHLGDS